MNHKTLAKLHIIKGKLRIRQAKRELLLLNQKRVAASDRVSGWTQYGYPATR